MSMVMSNRLENRKDPDGHSDYEAGGRPLNGWKVLAMFVGFFLVVGAVDGLMIYKALGTFSGEVTPHPYERGLAYNKEIAAGARAGGARLEGRRVACRAAGPARRRSPSRPMTRRRNRSRAWR